MNTATPTLVIHHAIMHPLALSTGVPRLVTQEVTLNGDNRDFLGRLVSASMKFADNYGIAQAAQISALDCCWAILDNPAELVAKSQTLAICLQDLITKNRSIKAGDLLVLVAEDQYGRLLAVLKMDAAQQFERVYTPQNGGWKVDILPTDQVVQSEDKPPQKCAFVRERNATGFGYHALLHDDQIHRQSVAQFFYRDFLGCNLVPTPVRRTTAFVETAELWRHEHQDRLHFSGIASLVQALWHYLKQPHVVFDEFARAMLEGSEVSEAENSDLRERLAQAVYPERAQPRPPAFVPHAGTVEKLIGTITVSLGDGIKLTAPAEQIIQILEAVKPDTADRQWLITLRRPVLELSVPAPRGVVVPPVDPGARTIV